MNVGSSSGTKCGRRRTSQTPPISTDLTSNIKVEGLRSRRGKTSIEAAMELKAKRETLLVSKVNGSHWCMTKLKEKK